MEGDSLPSCVKCGMKPFIEILNIQDFCECINPRWGKDNPNDHGMTEQDLKELREKPATSPKDIVRTLPSLKELHSNSVNWTNEELRKYDDLLDSYRMSVYRIYRLREDMEAEENE